MSELRGKVIYSGSKGQGVAFFVILLTAPIFTFLVFAQQSSAVEEDLDSAADLLTNDVKSALSLLSGKTQPIKAVMLPLSWQTADQWALCRMVSELLRFRISSIDGLELIDRESTSRALATLKIGVEKGLIAPEKLAELKGKLNQDIVVTGQIADLNTIININLYIWNADDGSAVSTASVQVRKTASIISLLIPPDQTEQEHNNYYSVKWRSMPLSYSILDMCVSDIDGDDITEIIAVTENEIKVLSWNGFSFWERASAQYVDSKQLKRNQRGFRSLLCSGIEGESKIYVSVPDGETTVWEWENDTIVKIESLPSTLLSMDGDDLIFSSLKPNRNFFSGQSTYRISKIDGSKAERSLPVDYYSIMIADVSHVEGKEWTLIDVKDCICIYSQNMEPIWQSKTPFGTCIVSADLDENGKIEIIASSAAPIGSNDSFIIMEWDGSNYIQKWESTLTNGSISAICIGDPNNDGVCELIVSVSGHGRSEMYLYTANYLH